jgi:hypothetical protein
MGTRRSVAARTVLRFAPGLVLAWALVLFTATSATGESVGRLDTDSAAFVVQTEDAGGASYFAAQAYFDTAATAPAAKIRISAPAGYSVDLAAQPGTEIGLLGAGFEDIAGSNDSFAFATAKLVAADPAQVASDPLAQACAPGAHAAVWTASLELSAQTLSLPVFVDQGGDAGAPFTVTVCPLRAPSSSLPGGMRLTTLILVASDIVHFPTESGEYTWNAAVTPARAGSYEADPSATFELRSKVPVPQVLTVRTKYDAKTHVATINGTLTAVGKPRAGARITLGGTAGSGSDFTLDDVRTDASGAFSVHRFVDKTTRFSAAVAVDTQPCSAPSTAPGACWSETISPPESVTATVKVPRATDPRRALRAGDQALARRSVLAAPDFPPDWRTLADDFDECFDFAPDLRTLTVTGEATSRLFVDPGGAAAVESTASVFRTKAEASKAFAREAVLGAVKCVAESSSGGGESVVALGSLRFPRVGDATRAFRVVVADTEGHRFYADLVTMRVGRSVIRLQTYALSPTFVGLERSLASKVAARAQR